MVEKIELHTLPVGSLMRANCYLASDPKTNECIIVDAGDDADYIERIIQDYQLTPKAIVATHGHFDHIMAATELKLAYNIPFMVHKNDEFLVKRMSHNAKYFLNFDPGPSPQIDKYLSKEIKIGKEKLKVIETPGHTPGSICLYHKETGIVLTGDTVFAGGGVGRTDFSYSDPNLLRESIKKIFKLPGNTIIYPGHEESSTIEIERQNISF